MKYILIVFVVFLSVSCRDNVESKLKGINYDKVVVYSFEARTPPPPPPNNKENLNSTFNIKNINIVENGKITLLSSEIKDKVVLNKNQVEQLIDFIKIDYCKNKATVAACYAPRHLIAFFEKGNLIAYYEFCIECGNDKRSENLYNYPEFCMEKGEKAEYLLKKFGIKYFGE